MADDAATPTGEVSESGADTEESDTEESDTEESDTEESDTEESDTEESDTDESDVDDDSVDEDQHATAAPAPPRVSHLRLATIAGLVLVLALGGLTGWLGFRAYESREVAEQRQIFLHVGRQGALNLATIDFEHADADVQRILDSATGTFYDEFQKNAQPFIEVVKQAKSRSVGTVTEAGVDTESDTEAKVLVAVTVRTSNASAAEQQPKLWRMRITVLKSGDDVKVSDVEFVP